VLGAIVDTGDAGFVAADVFQRNFDDVRRDPQLGHAGGAGAAEIV
jgi:hypothetical protein